MNSKQFILLSTPFVLLLLVLGYCTPKKHSPLRQITQVNQNYTRYLNRLDTSLTELKKAVETDQPSIQVQQAFQEARLAFKKIEFLAEYYNPYTVKSMNGPAIDEVEEDDPTEKIISPTGFQVMEELLFPVYESSSKKAVLQEIGILKACLNRLRMVNETTQMTDAHIFDAMRLQVYRIITLSISGFDSPVAFHSMPEAASSIDALQETFTIYKPSLQSKSPALSQQADHIFINSIQYLKQHSDFNTFDRAAFITRYANPLSRLLLEAQQALLIPLPSHMRAFSSKAGTLFDTNAFNPDYYAPDQNSYLTPAKVELGRLLFFDPILSGNGARSCASCHKPEKAFTDGQAKSIAFDFKGEVSRNAPTIINAGLQRASFHDMRVTFLEDQATDVLMNASEMHGSMQKAVNMLEQSAEYTGLFQKAFPQDSVFLTERNLKISIASYVRSLTSLNSRFDQYMRGGTTRLTALEKQGFNVFMGKAKCATCHFMPLFNGTVPPDFDKTEAEILGVPASKDTLHPRLDTDLGKFSLYNKTLHKFAVKTPTLRNIALTAPYMHNGVYDTLEEVVDFYNKGGGTGLGIDIPTQTLPDDKLQLSIQDKKSLIAFMQALTDTTALTGTPKRLPSFPDEVALNHRKVGGKY
ncbi:cytochrome-c peroxidase [Rhodocytophaga rosea]|uniref:Cytochrome-c peroxidase n=1 Tax=Rhodocytophaga rosea TaxID=2704465 RepID=A0A6C0GUE1_9BACT|nr:cytochrome c peroxidase [Rhodocytophaga rosea]QHT71666.1 cytochrome-c peroxidase [Rhodocytophaga rosea]